MNKGKKRERERKTIVLASDVLKGLSKFYHYIFKGKYEQNDQSSIALNLSYSILHFKKTPTLLMGKAGDI